MESHPDSEVSAPDTAPDHATDLAPDHVDFAPDHHAPDLAPSHAELSHAEFPADIAGGSQYGRAVRHVTGGGPIKYGEAVQFEFEFADGSREKFHAYCEEFPRIVSDLRGFAGIAERARRATPGRPVEVVNPYQATEARTDRVGPMIVVRFPTTDGIPVLIAMEAAVAEKLMFGIERELTKPTRR
jgi:hypothetical protein